MASESDPTAAREPSKELPWWNANIEQKITPDARRLLEEYSNIPPDQVVSHIHDVHEKAWAIRAYPCTGLGGFLAPNIAQHPLYPEILSKLKSGGALLDIGTFIGQDLRRLVIDGVPQENLYATDIVNHWDLGFEFFNDREKFFVQFIEADILNPTHALMALHGKTDVILVSHLLHQWGWDTQIRACKEFCQLSQPGSLIVGYQTGTNDIEKRSEWNRTRFFMHDPASFRRMWDQVGQETGTQWQGQAEIRPWAELGYTEKETGYLGEDFSLLRFTVKRLK